MQQQSNNRNKIVEVVHIDIEQIQFALNFKDGEVTSFKNLTDERISQLVGKRVVFTVVNERNRRLVFNLEIVRIDDETNKNSTNKRIQFKVLETSEVFHRQTGVITRLIKQPNKPSHIDLVNRVIYGEVTNNNSNRGKAKNNMTSEQWEELFDSKLDTHGYVGGVYLISGTINGTKYYYIGVTDDYKRRFKQHYNDGQGGRYEVYSDMILQADDGKMESIVVTDGVFSKEHMETVMETVFTTLFDFTGVKVVNSPSSGKYKSRNELIKLLITSKPCEVEILWDSYEVVKPYDELFITDEVFHYMNELYKLAYGVDMPNSIAQILDEMKVTLDEFVECIETVEVPPLHLGKVNKLKPIVMPTGRNKSRFDGYLGYEYKPEWKKTKPYTKREYGRRVYISVKDMGELVQRHVDMNKRIILDVHIVRGCIHSNIFRVEVKVRNNDKPIVLQFNK